MKQYRLKIPYYESGTQYNKGEILEFNNESRYHIKGRSSCYYWFPKNFVENNPDIFELIEEPEPQEEVIEGWASQFKESINIVFSEEPSKLLHNSNCYYYNTPARLILNPKPRKEYVRWVMKEFTENLKNDDCPIYRVIATKSDNEKYCHKIKITVEE